jgi:hypothetical protein
MRPAKLYAVGLSNRRAARVVIIQREPPKPDLREPPEPVRHVTWAKATPIVISVIALLISALGYREQHSTDTAAAVAARQQYARLVSAWLTREPSGPVLLTVQNLGKAPAVAPFVHLVDPGPDGQLKYSVILSMDDIPPCSVRNIELSRSTLRQLGGAADPYNINDIYIAVQDFSFVDANGILWDRTGDGTLQESGFDVHGGTFQDSKSAPANGC